MLTGRTLGPYRVKEKLGAGGMGEVYKAHDSRLDRTVALKVLTGEIATPDRVLRFEQEARAASALNHPNILTIHDVGRDDDVAYFAMEWVEGQTLRGLMSGRERLRVKRILDVAQQIAEGLAKAHAAGIVHRDLKPENVMLTADGLVKIVDFGIAKLEASTVGPAADTVTRTVGTSPGMVLGTLGYMSPEQASGKPVDYRSDQFALGLVIYEMATGRRPFERPTTAQSLAATIEADPVPIETLNRDVPAHLAAVVSRCLAKDPAERYESTRDLARDLKSISETGSRTAFVQPPAGPARSLRLYVSAAIVAIGLAVAGVGWWWSQRTAPPPEKPRPLVAVRPFRSLSADSAQGYFAAGVTEEIRGRLSQVSSLRLLSRNALEGPPGTDAAKIVRELGITQLVDGSVRLEGTRVRVTAELVDASTQQTLWSDQYDRDVADVLAVQSDVAMQIAKALQANLSPDERQRLEQRPTNNAEAYRMYLEARPLPGLDRTKNLAAIDLLRKAVALDPAFAMAHASIGFRQVTMGYYDSMSNIDEGIATTEAALRLNPSLAFGHFVLGTAYSMKGFDSKGRLAFVRALELDPNNASAMANLSVLESNFGRPGEGMVWARRMFALSGQKGNDFYHLAVPLLNLRADAATRQLLLEAERRYPTFARTQLLLAVLDYYEGRPEDANRRVAAILAREPEHEESKFERADFAYLTGSPDLGAALEAISRGGDANTLLVPLTVRLRRGYLLRKSGASVEAAKVLAETEKLARERIDGGDRTPSLRVEMAALAALRADHAGALAWLDRAFEAGFRDYGIIDRDPILLTIEPQAKVREVVDRMRRDIDAQRAHAQEGGLLDVDALLRPVK